MTKEPLGWFSSFVAVHVEFQYVDSILRKCDTRWLMPSKMVMGLQIGTRHKCDCALYVSYKICIHTVFGHVLLLMRYLCYAYCHALKWWASETKNLLRANMSCASVLKKSFKLFLLGSWTFWNHTCKDGKNAFVIQHYLQESEIFVLLSNCVSVYMERILFQTDERHLMQPFDWFRPCSDGLTHSAFKI